MKPLDTLSSLPDGGYMVVSVREHLLLKERCDGLQARLDIAQHELQVAQKKAQAAEAAREKAEFSVAVAKRDTLCDVAALLGPQFPTKSAWEHGRLLDPTSVSTFAGAVESWACAKVREATQKWTKIAADEKAIIRCGAFIDIQEEAQRQLGNAAVYGSNVRGIAETSDTVRNYAQRIIRDAQNRAVADFEKSKKVIRRDAILDLADTVRSQLGLGSHSRARGMAENGDTLRTFADTIIGDVKDNAAAKVQKTQKVIRRNAFLDLMEAVCKAAGVKEGTLCVNRSRELEEQADTVQTLAELIVNTLRPAFSTLTAKEKSIIRRDAMVDLHEKVLERAGLPREGWSKGFLGGWSKGFLGEVATTADDFATALLRDVKSCTSSTACAEEVEKRVVAINNALFPLWQADGNPTPTTWLPVPNGGDSSELLLAKVRSAMARIGHALPGLKDATDREVALRQSITDIHNGLLPLFRKVSFSACLVTLPWDRPVADEHISYLCQKIAKAVAHLG